MFKIQSVFNRLTVLIVRLEKEGRAGVCRYDFVRKNKKVYLEKQEEGIDCREWQQERVKNPVLLVISGYGVIRKVFMPDEMKDMERITGNAEFLWSERETETGSHVVAFMRQERINDLLQLLEQAKTSVVGIQIGTIALEDNLLPEREYNEQEIARCWGDWFYGSGIKWCELSKPGDKGNMLCSLLLNKIKLTLLVSLLVLLLINYLWNGQVRGRHSALQAELVCLETNLVQQEKLSGEMEKIVADFNRAGGQRCVGILDRIASLVPAEVTLEGMTVNPLLKSIEEKKPLIVRQGYIEITGVTPLPEKVTSFTSDLSALPNIREVKLASLESSRENGLFYFRIWIRL